MADKTYARIADGAVFELATFDASLDVTELFHSDLVWVDVTNASPPPQQGWIYTAPASFAAPPPPTLTPQQQLQALIAGGLTISSTGTPAIEGLYRVDSGAQQDIAAEAQFISSFAEFTTGETTNLPWVLLDGVTVVIFPTTDAFMAFAKAAAQFVSAAKIAAAQNASLPSASVTIA